MRCVLSYRLPTLASVADYAGDFPQEVCARTECMDCDPVETIECPYYSTPAGGSRQSAGLSADLQLIEELRVRGWSQYCFRCGTLVIRNLVAGS